MIFCFFPKKEKVGRHCPKQVEVVFRGLMVGEKPQKSDHQPHQTQRKPENPVENKLKTGAPNAQQPKPKKEPHHRDRMGQPVDFGGVFCGETRLGDVFFAQDQRLPGRGFGGRDDVVERVGEEHRVFGRRFLVGGQAEHDVDAEIRPRLGFFDVNIEQFSERFWPVGGRRIVIYGVKKGFAQKVADPSRTIVKEKVIFVETVFGQHIFL